MARRDVPHRCRLCGAPSVRWEGRCPACSEWNTLEPHVGARDERGDRVGFAGSGRCRTAPEVVSLAGVDPGAGAPVPSGIREVDRVLAGGLVPGSTTLVYGEPGVGKSTLLLQVLASVATGGRSALLVAGEESPAQVRVRAGRLGALPEALLVVEAREVGVVEQAVEDCQPALVVVDSIQSLVDPAARGPAGSPSQIRACAERLGYLAARTGAALVLVGHVTKGGDLAGPRLLEHLVDTVVSFGGDRHGALRVLRAVKHRFGPTGEVGLFEMAEGGLREVADPGTLLLADRRPEVPGGAVAALLQGRRPVLVELQALVCSVPGPPGTRLLSPPRLSVQGVDAARLGVVLAVLGARGGVDMRATEIFVSATGGVRATEPAADLALALALVSAAGEVALPDDMVVFGELGLAGEVRQVPGSAARLAEASRLGFRRALGPAPAAGGTGDIEMTPVATLADAVRALPALISVPGAPTGRSPGTPPDRHRGPGRVPAGALGPGTISAWSSAGAPP